ncbi:hypothetical protein CSC2_22640 [Clostridium zeae]|uniref:Uncharacterized protein n=1 Tax=Clostridium zeae TaxID=2759022 RepID=A0ABQ1EAI7_9CLOT|nr:hypothetical protein [Clostridium zeae]GFZ31738.1 hypothetical protein CSC2_22640 [Clostridium zeae]
MKNRIKLLIGGLTCSLMIGIAVQANISWGGKATPLTHGMMANSYSKNTNDTSFYRVTADLTFSDPSYNTIYHEPAHNSYVDSSGNANASTGDITVYTNVAHVSSYHVWYTRSGDDPAEVTYHEYN